MMDQLIKNQKYVFISILISLTLVGLTWYYFFYIGLSKEYKKSRQIRRILESDVKKFRQMESQIAAMQIEWDALNSEFGSMIERIPDKKQFEIA